MSDSASQRAAFLTVDQVAERLQVAPRTVRRWLSSGDLIGHRLGRAIRISETDLALFLGERRGLD